MAAGRVIVISGLILIATELLLLAFAYLETHGELVHLLEQDLQNAISGAMSNSEPSLAETQALEDCASSCSVPLMVRIMPGITVSLLPGNCLAKSARCAGGIGRKMAVDLCVREDLKCWKAPEVLVWIVIASGLMLLLPSDVTQIAALEFAHRSRERIFFSRDLRLRLSILKKWNMPFFLRSLIYAIMVLQQFASLATALLGLFDMWFDFRKMAKKPA